MRKFLSIIGLFLSLTACTNQVSNSTNSDLVVFAASSLTNAYMELADRFEAQNPDVTVSLNFASSSQLAAQIIEGAQADIFASANQTQMEKLVDAGLVTGQPQTFAANQLTLLVPKDNSAHIQSLADLANPGITLILAAPATPIRVYSDDIIQNYNGEEYAEAVYANLASEEANVRQVVTKIALGEGDAGFAYTSDLTPDIAEYVLNIPIPTEYNLIANYPIVIMNNSQNQDTAAQFIAFTLSAEGQAILTKWGFISAETADD